MVIISESNASVIIEMLSAQLDYQNQLIEKLRNTQKILAEVSASPEAVRKREEVIGAVIIALLDNHTGIPSRTASELGFCHPIPLINLLLTYAGRKYPHPRTCDGKVKRDIEKLETVTGIKICE